VKEKGAATVKCADMASRMCSILDEIENWRPAPHEARVGEVLSYDLFESRYGSAHTMLLREPTPDRVWRVWLSSRVLEQAFRRHKPKIGEEVGIRYRGKPPNKG
jgi:hypothetical protein